MEIVGYAEISSVYKWCVFFIGFIFFKFQNVHLTLRQSAVLSCLVSDSLLYVKGLLLLEDLPLAEFHARRIYFYLSEGKLLVASECVVVVVNWILN